MRNAIAFMIVLVGVANADYFNEYVGQCWTGEGPAVSHDDVSIYLIGSFPSSNDCRDACFAEFSSFSTTYYAACEYDATTSGCSLLSYVVVTGGDNTGSMACWVFTGESFKT